MKTKKPVSQAPFSVFATIKQISISCNLLNYGISGIKIDIHGKILTFS